MKLIINGINFHASDLCGPFWTSPELEKMRSANISYGLAPIIIEYIKLRNMKETEIAHIKTDKSGMEIKIFKIPQRLQNV